MNDDSRLEQLDGDGLHQLAPTRAPDRLRTRIKSETSEMAPRPRWLALIKEPPMRTNSHLAVGSPTWRVAAVVAATALMATLVVGASFAGAQLLAKDGFIVDASGGGTHTSIAAAVADADDGDEVFVRPGNYTEGFELDKSLTIQGDGPVEEIIVTAPEEAPFVILNSPGAPDWYAIHVTGGEPVIQGLTFSGEPSAIVVTGGSPTLQDLVFENVGWAFPTRGIALNGSSIVVSGSGTEAQVKTNVLRNGGPVAVFDEARADIDGNKLIDGPHLFLRESAEGVTVTDNEIIGTLRRGLNLNGLTAARVAGNTFTDFTGTAIRVKGGQGSEVAGNVIVGGPNADRGVYVESLQSGLQLSDNSVTGTMVGILWASGDGTMTGNTSNGNSVGIRVQDGSPVVSGNTACDNESSNFSVSEGTRGAAPEVGENDFCEEPAA